MLSAVSVVPSEEPRFYLAAGPAGWLFHDKVHSSWLPFSIPPFLEASLCRADISDIIKSIWRSEMWSHRARDPV